MKDNPSMCSVSMSSIQMHKHDNCNSVLGSNKIGNDNKSQHASVKTKC